MDLASPQSSLFLNPLGQDGNEFSSDYDNLLVDWTVGHYLPMQNMGYPDSGGRQTMET